MAKTKVNLVLKCDIRQKLSKKEAKEDYDDFIRGFSAAMIINKSKSIQLLKSKRDTAFEQYYHYGKLSNTETTDKFSTFGSFYVKTSFGDNEWSEESFNQGRFVYWQEMAERLNMYWFLIKPEEKVKPPKKEAPLFKDEKLMSIAKLAFENVVSCEKVAKEKITPTHIKSAYTAFDELDILSERTRTIFIRKFGSMYGLEIKSGKNISLTNTPKERERTNKIKTEYNKLKSKVK